MSSATSVIAALDRALAIAGSDAILRRIYGSGGNLVNSDVGVRVKANAVTEKELESGIAQTDSKVIMSPSQIASAQWPGGELPSRTVPDPTLPRRMDKLIVDGRVRNVEFVEPIRFAGELVRIEMRISG